MRILVIHQYYLMPGQSGGSRFNEMARLWSEAGHHVSVIAGNVDYATGHKPAKYDGRWLTRERDGAVDVWRCHVSRSYGRGYRGRMWAFFVFALSAASAIFRIKRPDVIISTSPPLVVAIPGFLAARARWFRCPWIFEVRDLWPESAVTTGVLGPNSFVTRALYLLERWSYRSADRINVLTPAFKEDIVGRRLALGEKISVIPNGADLDSFHPPSGPADEVRRRLGWEGKFVVLYAGVHGRANALKQLVDAAECLRDRLDVLIVCVGDGPERAALETDRQNRQLTNIVFLGAQPKATMPDFIGAADAGAAVLQNNPTFRTVYPNKIFDYMACARPTLLAIDGIARKLVCDEARAGVFAEPENPQAIAAAIRSMADDRRGCREMGARGHQWVRENASRGALAKRYLELIAELCRTDGEPEAKPVLT